MLTLIIPESEYYDSEQNLFYNLKEQTLVLEHSLYSIAKWEARWKKPYLSYDRKSIDETIDYIRCMTVNKNVDPSVYIRLTGENLKAIQAYIDDPMTATTFSDQNKRPKRSRKIITSEEIYWQMTALNIPFECDKWHFNRLQTLIKICSIRNAPPKKMGRKETLNRNRALNEARKAQMHTNG